MALPANCAQHAYHGSISHMHHVTGKLQTSGRLLRVLTVSHSCYRCYVVLHVGMQSALGASS